jgi:hypothetical protein
MFDYTYTVKSSDGYEWGLFKTKSQASLMRDALVERFGKVLHKIDYWVEEIK